MLVWVSSIQDQNIQTGADTESYFYLHVVSLDTNQKERPTVGTWRSITRLTPDGLGALALVGCPPRRGEQDNKATGKIGSSAMVGNSPRRETDIKPVARGHCWHCPSLLGYGS